VKENNTIYIFIREKIKKILFTVSVSYSRIF
jgi:hypothetical protein